MPQLKVEAATTPGRLSALEKELIEGNRKLNDECAQLLLRANAKARVDKQLTATEEGLAKLKEQHDGCFDEIRELLKSSNEWKNEFQKADDEKKDAVEENGRLCTQVQELQASGAAAELRAGTAESKAVDAEKNLTSANQLIKDQQGNLTRRQSQVNDLQNQLTDLRNEKRDLDNQLVEKDRQWDNLSKAKAHLEGELGQEKSDKEAAEKARDESQTKLAPLESANNNLQSDFTNLKKKLEVSSTKLLEQQDLTKTHEGRIGELSSDVERLQQELAQINEAHKKQVGQIGILGAEKAELARQIQGLKEEKISLNQRLETGEQTLQEQDVSHTKALEVQQKAATEEFGKLQSAKKGIETALANSRETCNGRDTHIKKLRGTVHELTKTVDEREATVSQLGDIVAIVAGAATTEMQAICTGWSVATSMIERSEMPL